MSRLVSVLFVLLISANVQAATYRIFGEGTGPRGVFETIVFDLTVEPGSEEIEPVGLPQITYQNIMLTGEIGGNEIQGTQSAEQITYYDYQVGDTTLGFTEGFFADVRFSGTFVATIQIALYDYTDQDIWQLTESGDLFTADVANAILSGDGNESLLRISYGGTPFEYQITNIGQVPLPAAAWLFLSALGAGFGMRWVKRKRA